jgi:hypothetical protein
VYIVQVVQEVLQLVGSMWPDDEGVILSMMPDLQGCKAMKVNTRLPFLAL